MGKNKWIMWVLATLAVILIYQFVYGLAQPPAFQYQLVNDRPPRLGDTLPGMGFL